MKTADLITSYLNNEMSPDQERQFLISVASSDSLRLALKSHVMLDRIIIGQVQHTHVPEMVRSTIFANASAAVAGLAPDALPSAPSSSVPATEPSAAPASPFARFFGRGVVMSLLIGCGFTAGYLLHPEQAPVSASIVPSGTAHSISPATSQVGLPQASAPQQLDAATGSRVSSTAGNASNHTMADRISSMSREHGAAVVHSTVSRDSAHKTSTTLPADVPSGAAKTVEPAAAATTTQAAHNSNDAQVDMRVVQPESTQSAQKEQGGIGHP